MRFPPASSVLWMRFSELDGRSIGVWGLGREIRSFVAQVKRRLAGAQVTVAVSEDPADDVTGAIGPDVRVVGPAAAVEALGECDVVVRSPGVSIYRPELRELAASGVPIVTATGLWLAERQGRRVIGITGTKGKSTTATLVAELLRAAGCSVQLAGNIGRPALDLLDVPEADGDWVVVELSSYQTADLVTGPAVAVVTNLYKEHTDWHEHEATYRRDKLRLLTLPGVTACVLPADLDVDGVQRCARFDQPDGWHVVEDGVRHRDGTVISESALPLRGRHNAVNLCAALTAIDAAGLARPALPSGLRDVRPLPHRLQTVGTADGLEWVDDSISTTPESTMAALEAFGERPVVLIAGGQDREQDYGALGKLIAERDVVVVGVPTTGERVVGAARAMGADEDRAYVVEDLATAVGKAREAAAADGVVLLSPAAPSYDRYRNFEERGEHFARLAAGRFAAVPGLPATSAGAQVGIASWIDSEALAALVAEFGALPDDWARRDLGSRLTWLDEFSERWDFRRGAERNLAVDADFGGERAELIVAAATALGLTGVAPPAATRYDHVLILGGLLRACLARPLHAARLIGEGQVVTRSVTALGGYRRLDGDELALAKLVDDEPADEFEAMDAGVRHAFGVERPVDERGDASEIVGAAWRVRTYRGADDIPINVIAAPSTEPGRRRANTPDTYEWFAAEFAHLQRGERLLVITTAIYVPFQHANALRLFALPFGVQVDTVGMRPGDLDPRLSQEFRPHNYLQEVRSTIRALGDLHAALERRGETS